MAEWPDLLPGYDWLASRYGRMASDFASPPDLLVVHSGAAGPDVAKYLSTVPDGRAVSCHFAWLASGRQFVQMVRLTQMAWHAGPPTNHHSIGVELSGPWYQDPRDPDELAAFRRLVVDLTAAIPTLRYWSRHSDLSAAKSDPGPGFPDQLCAGLGLSRVRNV